MKYKEKDRVRIKSLDWYNENKDEYGYVRCTDFLFTPEHSKYCGYEFTISHITEFQIPSYVMESNGHEWTDDMIEGLVEEEEEVGLIDVFSSRWINEFNLPEGYIFKDENGNVINATKIVLEKKKKEYPKTYEECCEVLDWNHRDYDRVGYKSELLCKLQVLLLCRDAYWEIAGEELSLGRPWEPDWNTDDVKHSLVNVGNTIIPSTECKVSRIFAFPTKEMRDAFYENFKELIEQCKELL